MKDSKSNLQLREMDIARAKLSTARTLDRNGMIKSAKKVRDQAEVIISTLPTDLQERARR